MAKNSEAPAGKAGATRGSFGGLTRDLSTLDNLRAQTLMHAYSVRPEWAVMVAAMAFGSTGHG